MMRTSGRGAGTRCRRWMAILFALLVPLAAAAQTGDSLDGRPIVDIRLVGAKTLAKDSVAKYLGITIGEPLDREKIRAGFTQLWDSGLLADLSIDAEAAPGNGVVVVVKLAEKARIEKVEFEGNRKVANSEIEEKLKSAKVEVGAGSRFSAGDAARMKAAIRELYETQGFKAAFVDYRLEPPDAVQAKLIVQIDEGDRTKVQAIAFSGNSVISSWWLRLRLKHLAQARWWKFWAKNDVFTPEAYAEAAGMVKKIYHEQGYKNVQVGDPVVEYRMYDTRSGWRLRKTTERRAHVVMPITEGEQFYFGDIKFEGISVFPPESFAPMFLCPKGTVMKRSRFDDGLEALEARYRRNGYIYAFTNPDFEEKEGNLVDITVKVAEGQQFRLGRLEFAGNDRTRDKVLRREVKLAEGDIMDMEAFKTSMFKVQQLGFFRLDEDPVEFQTDDENKTVNVTVKGEEIGRNDIQFGGGYSELDRWFVQFQFNTRNFLGNGETLSASYTSGRRRNFFELGYTNPWFLDRRHVLGASVFNRNTKYQDYEDRRRGGSVVYGIGMRDFETVTAYYSYQNIDARFETISPFDDDGGAGGEGGDDGQMLFSPFGLDPFGDEPIDDGPALERVRGRTSSLTPIYRYDSRDDPFDAWRGTRVTMQAQIAGGLLGGTNDFVKPEVHFTHYHPVARRLSLALNVEGGWIIPYGGSEIPLFERWRLGGDRSIRGFGFGTIVPRDENGALFRTELGSVMGGDKYMQLNFELMTRIAGPLKFVLFADAGNTWIEDEGARLGDLRYSAGAEVRIFVPVFQAPLRFIYGVNLDPEPWEDKSDFQFTIGTTF